MLLFGKINKYHLKVTLNTNIFMQVFLCPKLVYYLINCWSKFENLDFSLDKYAYHSRTCVIYNEFFIFVMFGPPMDLEKPLPATI